MTPFPPSAPSLSVEPLRTPPTVEGQNDEGGGATTFNEQDVQALLDVLPRFRFHFGNEHGLQNGLEFLLKKKNIPFEREPWLNAQDRPDFLVGGSVVVEVKIKGGLADTLRQVARYAQHDKVHHLLVVGTPSWLVNLPSQLNGKPLHHVRLVGSLL